MLNAPVEYLIDSGISITVIHSTATEMTETLHFARFSLAEIVRFIASKLSDITWLRCVCVFFDLSLNFPSLVWRHLYGKECKKRARWNKVKLYPRCAFFCITIKVFLRDVESNAYAFCFFVGEVEGTNKMYHGLVKDSTPFQLKGKSGTDNSCHFLSL